jgi:hypothetical protein
MNACNAENGLCHNEQLLGAGRFSFGGLLRESGRLVIYRQVRESGRLRGTWVTWALSNCGISWGIVQGIPDSIHCVSLGIMLIT